MLETGSIVTDEMSGRVYKVIGTKVFRTVFGQSLWLILEDCVGKEVRLPAARLKPFIE
jgi:hypothetical protein